MHALEPSGQSAIAPAFQPHQVTFWAYMRAEAGDDNMTVEVAGQAGSIRGLDSHHGMEVAAALEGTGCTRC